MNKKEFINRLSTSSDLTNSRLEIMVNFILEGIKEAMNDEDRLIIKGFGKFEKVTRKERTMKNLNTGEKYVVPEHKAIIFKPSKNFTR